MKKQFEDIKKGLLEAIEYENGRISAKRNILLIAPLKKYSSKEIKKNKKIYIKNTKEHLSINKDNYVQFVLSGKIAASGICRLSF